MGRHTVQNIAIGLFLVLALTHVLSNKYSDINRLNSQDAYIISSKLLDKWDNELSDSNLYFLENSNGYKITASYSKINSLENNKTIELISLDKILPSKMFFAEIIELKGNQDSKYNLLNNIDIKDNMVILLDNELRMFEETNNSWENVYQSNITNKIKIVNKNKEYICFRIRPLSNEIKFSNFSINYLDEHLILNTEDDTLKISIDYDNNTEEISKSSNKYKLKGIPKRINITSKICIEEGYKVHLKVSSASGTIINKNTIRKVKINKNLE